ncbi:hypothetical protein H310_09723 [Aphanomyces invadans]|uniref:DDE-1 domain-containing protein n=1 Tax=Aphanomyces invadans TaxID=157072 RepID=A0A024TTT4_9STRA|nr:hypothetical protein H310_09723 [Aphanomyces invadans]ETV97389.1 hypothetical protein H310_09723 [Aphanomyces invadans]|eukprot:XP_008874097.1 hypothetical protein H310_09723 [Aphanomyces invadans]
MQPRCFNGRTAQDFGFHYRSSKKAWMTSEVFSTYLKSINDRMVSEGRKILLLWTTLPAMIVKLVKPQDVAIIASFKAKVKERQLKNALDQIDSVTAGRQDRLYEGGCLFFNKCHADRRAPNDKHMNWVFWGEEYLRSMQLWTRGYDLYSPSKYGHVVFHNWSDDKGMKKQFWDNVTQLAYNQFRMVLTLPFKGPVDAEEIDKYHGGKVRSVQQFLKFSGISNTNPALDEFRCEQLHWVPYAVPEIIEAFLPDYTMRPIPVPNETNRTTGVDGTLGHQEDIVVQRLHQLEALKVPSTDQLQHLREIRHEIASLNQPHEDLWPLAFVWLGVISVWLVYKNRRNADVAGGSTTP